MPEEITANTEPVRTRGFNSEEKTNEFRDKILEVMKEYECTDFVGGFANITDNEFQDVILCHTGSRKYIIAIARFLLGIANFDMAKVDEFLKNYLTEEAKKHAVEEAQNVQPQDPEAT